ncbi:MAG: hypothetical protein DYG87_06045 [Anaerolineae bacterium CFX3]|nr:hypothetical protein [Anaerolineales bacterium]MCC7512722.1 hypothetical protein [Anaerolineae bacterium]MCE7905340.1 hypothetical protein [Anaerolineae bacterium CFX3]MCQ3945431.1 hypothetical protein [Anaerolineae bacterium]RIK27775.1 MAG: hypothetical protein DCC54_02195 [Anaerolineae bacterium]
MSVSQVLEVAIGLIFVFYVLGSIISFVTRLILDSAETRGAALETHLKRIAGDKTVDLVNLPQLKALQPIRYKGWTGVFGAKTEAKKLEKVPVNVLVDAFFDMTGLTGRPNVDAAELTAIVAQMPESEAKQAMLKWIQQGVTNFNELRTRANDYFSGILVQASATFKANARSVVIILSAILVLGLGTDSVQIAKDLWNNAEMRTVAAAKATMVAQQEGGGIEDLNQILQHLSETNIRFTWWHIQDTFPPNSGAPWAEFILLKIVGLALSVLAVSQGSSFWYDILKKLTGKTSNPLTDEAKG